MLDDPEAKFELLAAMALRGAEAISLILEGRRFAGGRDYRVYVTGAV